MATGLMSSKKLARGGRPRSPASLFPAPKSGCCCPGASLQPRAGAHPPPPSPAPHGDLPPSPARWGRLWWHHQALFEKIFPVGKSFDTESFQVCCGFFLWFFFVFLKKKQPTFCSGVVITHQVPPPLGRQQGGRRQEGVPKPPQAWGQGKGPEQGPPRLPAALRHAGEDLRPATLRLEGGSNSGEGH